MQAASKIVSGVARLLLSCSSHWCPHYTGALSSLKTETERWWNRAQNQQREAVAGGGVLLVALVACGVLYYRL